MKNYKAIIIGSGFGGGISACRLGKAWPGDVLVVERGKRYPLGSFPRKPKEVSTNFFNLPEENIRRPRHIPAHTMTGMYDVRSYKQMDVVTAAGLGGGSLIYANVFMEPPEDVFDQRWAANIKKDQLAPYYKVARQVLGSRPIPDMNEPRREIIRTKYFEKAARDMNLDSQRVDLNVFFGNDFENPTPLGVQETNSFGKLQTSCTYCAECCMGCNTQSKNSIDMNYLHVAESKYQVEILLEHKASKITPLNAQGYRDPAANGEFGFLVEILDLNTGLTKSFTAQKVVVAAGTLGTNELLLRCRDEYQTLPRISSQLGQGFSGNGDFLAFLGQAKAPADPNYGPVITQRIDYNLFNQFNKDRAFVMEDASYPALLAWFAEGEKPLYFKMGAILDFLKAIWMRLLGRHKGGKFTSTVISRFLGHDISWNTSIHLCMGVDKSNGKISLDPTSRQLNLVWPLEDSLSLYQGILRAVDTFKKVVGGKFWFPLPTWHLKRNITVHPLGGARLSESATDGVTKVGDEDFGELHNYRNIYVADGALCPSAVGANPSATIAALAEKVSHGITGERPLPEL